MRFSVLLPTRNGGQYLVHCLDSVLNQAYSNLELVVSDNANTDETAEVLARFADDARLKVVQLDEVVPVTDNWNAALAASSGDYLLMIGDDDALVPGFFTRAEALLERHGHPDCLTYNGYRYVAPGSVEGFDGSHYGEPYFNFEPELDRPGLWPKELRVSLVHDMYRFRTRFPLTMQLTLVSRAAADRLRSGLFKSAFPDHYALGALLLTAERWAYAPERLVVVGISEKSFGHYFFTSEDACGLEYLRVDNAFPGRLPGSEVLNTLYSWLLTLKADYGPELEEIEVDRGEYLVRQVWAWYKQRRVGSLSMRGALRRARLVSPREWAAVARALARSENLAHAARLLRRNRADRTHTLSDELRPLPGVGDIAEFAEWLDADPSRRLAARV